MLDIERIKILKHIKSPLNYTGNKFRILDQIQPYFPKKIDVMVDLFCGGATVGLNTECNKVIFIDNEPRIIWLLKYLSGCNIDKLLNELFVLIDNYGLSCSFKNGYKYYRQQILGGNPNNGLKDYNSNGFYKLRDDYNAILNKNTATANKLLYLLIVYGFNNDIRFSKDGKYNLPVGKTDLNNSNVKKLTEYIERVKNIQAEFICGDFCSQHIQQIIRKADFVYMDPPYLITDAVYNESNKWREQNEYELIRLMNFLLDNKKSFVLSNVLEKQGRRNEPLFYWTTTRKNDINIVDIDYHYRSASYNKKNRNAKEREVIICPAGVRTNDRDK
ncbi:MAG: hypothetical protein BHW39_05415 [Firmicutes bacterium CAG:552_39_19]|nr:MAG: hypothetical protein BHW39_05415 [Firmicutes bacterium CAG:552_39_19]